MTSVVAVLRDSLLCVVERFVLTEMGEKSDNYYYYHGIRHEFRLYWDYYFERFLMNELSRRTKEAM